jgi:hypothetical protein
MRRSFHFELFGALEGSRNSVADPEKDSVEVPHDLTIGVEISSKSSSSQRDGTIVARCFSAGKPGKTDVRRPLRND